MRLVYESFRLAWNSFNNFSSHVSFPTWNLKSDFEQHLHKVTEQNFYYCKNNAGEKVPCANEKEGKNPNLYGKDECKKNIAVIFNCFWKSCETQQPSSSP